MNFDFQYLALAGNLLFLISLVFFYWFAWKLARIHWDEVRTPFIGWAVTFGLFTLIILSVFATALYRFFTTPFPPS